MFLKNKIQISKLFDRFKITEELSDEAAPATDPCCDCHPIGLGNREGATLLVGGIDEPVLVKFVFEPDKSGLYWP